ncbi:MAG TPA: hypothetical protein VN258_11370, partial [Mobilitalea sp.]|nr:hypothetical protein [Mobilitalea sp.]
MQTTSVKASTSASVLTFEASSSASVLTFEAEAAEVITGSVSDSGSASGGKVVGGLGRSGDYDGYIQFNNISAPPSGKYLLHIYYQSAQFRRLDIIVNGGEPMMTYCGFQQAGDWSAIYIKTVIVDLNSGVNNLKLGASVEAWCPNIDKIELEPYTADSYESENAETAELTGNARIA